MSFKIGQKWISHAEPELAMGRIIRIENRRVSVYFDVAGEERTYASENPPLSRARFNPGDRITTGDGITLTVVRSHDHDGILVYHGDYQGTPTTVMETELDPNVRFSNPADRLFTGQLDANEHFVMRYRSWQQLSRLSRFAERGLVGARVSLIPHQLYIANEVGHRFAPRVLLADEVGLGKTIEAGLIMHHQLQTGRAQRVLVIVPPALTFQWFVELIRRFNLQFTVLDEQRCLEIAADNAALPEEASTNSFNVFDAQQLMLCNLDLFLDNQDRLAEALEAEWDLVVVDEAHHLAWEALNPSPAYRVVENLSKVSAGLLLLTATPEQLGKSGHFARLRLLDPDRFHDFAEFEAEEGKFEQVATLASDLLDGDDQAKAHARQALSNQLGEAANDEGLIRKLLDRHGTGRVLFRNVRRRIAGFPKRNILPVPLQAPTEYPVKGQLFPEQAHPMWTAVDPRVGWLIKHLQDNPGTKFLLICAHQQTVIDLEQWLSARTPIRLATFHEGMNLVARDRAANYFAESERGAQLLICSEIGSEGRNFQFASNLVLFDLPAAPDLVEQRIGRLDRIGQKHDINLLIPYLEGSATDTLYQLFHQGLRLFSAPNPVAQEVFSKLAETWQNAPLADLIEATQKINRERLEALDRGRDVLLELNSHDAAVSSTLIEHIDELDKDQNLEAYMEASFELNGLESDDLGDGVWLVKPTEGMQRHESISLETQGHYHYPELPEEGVRFTYERLTALAREDVSFWSWEHPLVQQAVDNAVSDVYGNSSMIAIKHPGLKAGTLLLEVIYVIDAPGPARLGVDRFLPAEAIRTLLAPDGQDLADRLAFQTFEEMLLDVPGATLVGILESQRPAITALLEKAEAYAGAALASRTAQAIDTARARLGFELDRLLALKKVNPSVREDEIEKTRDTLEQVEAVINNAGLRTDAIRVIVAA